MTYHVNSSQQQWIRTRVLNDLCVTWSWYWQVRLSLSSMTSSMWARDNSWYGNVCGGELKSPQMMRAQSVTDWWLLLLLLLADDDDDDDVVRTNCCSSLTANDAYQHTQHNAPITRLSTISYHTLLTLSLSHAATHLPASFFLSSLPLRLIRHLLCLSSTLTLSMSLSLSKFIGTAHCCKTSSELQALEWDKERLKILTESVRVGTTTGQRQRKSV